MWPVRLITAKPRAAQRKTLAKKSAQSVLAAKPITAALWHHILILPHLLARPDFPNFILIGRPTVKSTSTRTMAMIRRAGKLFRPKIKSKPTMSTLSAKTSSHSPLVLCSPRILAKAPSRMSKSTARARSATANVLRLCQRKIATGTIIAARASER